jgi:hypothetical protein
MAEINFTVKEADFSNFYGERIDEIAGKALEALTGFFKTIVALGDNEAQIFPDDIGNAGLGLVNNARSEILGAIHILYEHFGTVSVKRASYRNELGVPPESMTGGIAWWPEGAERAVEIVKPQAAAEGGAA